MINTCKGATPRGITMPPYDVRYFFPSKVPIPHELSESLRSDTMKFSVEYKTWKNLLYWAEARDGTVIDPGIRTFEGFLQAFGPRPTPRHQLKKDRGSRVYGPATLRWVEIVKTSKARVDLQLEFVQEGLEPCSRIGCVGLALEGALCFAHQERNRERARRWREDR